MALSRTEAQGWTRPAIALTSIAILAMVGRSAAFSETPKEGTASKETSRTRPLNEEQVKRHLASFRGTRTPNARRIVMIKELAVNGPEVVSRVEPVILGELDRVGATAPDRSDSTPYDDELARLRQQLVELRQDPELTKEKIVAVGDPVLERLRVVALQRAQKLQPRETAREKVRLELAKWQEFLERLEKDADDVDASRPFGLPTVAIKTQLQTISMQVAFTPEETWAREVQAHNAEVFRKLDAREASGMQLMNDLRILVGLNPLKADLQLSAAARGHSADMAAGDFFAHESPVPNKKTFVDRAQLEGTTASGENIFAGSPNPNAAISGWFHSPGHHKNMLGSCRRQGLGRFNGHWTQLFGQ